ncbi:hypothetical protein PF007_g31943 [Phytophthora fragariae]|nr:hypothetical protein PF007_g31943 [Phytophthora fragariae]KAE9162353.1 hypothetical protein PF004_g30519 [Phytophthora fragariae]
MHFAVQTRHAFSAQVQLRNSNTSATDIFNSHAPQSNIDEGDVGVGGFNKRSCGAIRKEPAVATTDKYVQTKALAEKIVDRMTLQSTPTYSVALQWMQEFYDALQVGDVPKFVMEVSPRIGLEELPQVSSENRRG